MANRKNTNKNRAVFDASQIGELEAMQLAAINGLTLRQVGVKPTLKNRIEFIKLLRDVNRTS